MSLFKNAVGALLVGAAFCTPALAQDDSGDRDTMEVAPGEPASSGSDADKTIARGKAVMLALETLCGDRFSFATIRGDARKEMVKGMFGILRNEKWKERGGKWRYTAECSKNEAMNIVLDALKVDETFGAQQFMIVACPTQWWEGPVGEGQDKLAEGVAKKLGEQTAKAMSEFLMEVRMRKAPAANNTENVARAAQDLGTDPQTAQLASFADAFGVPVCVSVQGSYVFESWPTDDPNASIYRGTISCSQLAARIYHKDSKTILAEFEIKMSRPRRTLGLNSCTADNSKMDQFPVATVGTKQSMRAAAEEYAQVVGLVLGKAMCKKLCDVYYSRQAPTGGGGGGAQSGPRKCPGCGDTIVSPDPKKCPACDSDLPAATGGGGGGGGAATFRNPGPTDHYEFRFVNWTGSGADEIVEALQGSKTGFGNFKEGDQQGNIRIFKCTFVGEMIVRQVNTALEDCGKKGVSQVQKSGNTITITRNN